MSNVKMATAVSTAALKSEKVPHRAKSKEEQGVRENLGWLAATPGILRMGAGVLVRVYVQVKRAVLAHSRVYLVADRGTSVSNDSSGPRDIEILPHSMVMVELVRNSHWFVRSERWHSADVVQDTLRKPQVKLAGMILTSADKLLCGFNNALTAFGKHYVLAANNCRNFSRVFLDHLSLSTDGRPVTVSEHVIDRATDWAMGPFEKMYAAVTSKPTGERGLQLLRSSLQAKSTPSTPGGGDPVVGEADTAQDTRRKLLRQLSDRGKQAFTTATANDAPANDAAGNGAANQAKPGGTGDTGGTGHGSGGGSSPPAKQGSNTKETATLLGGGAGAEALARCPRDVRVAAAAAMAAPVVLTAVQLRGTYKKLEAGDINTRDAAYRTGKHSAGAVVGVAGAGAAVAVGVTMAASAPLLAVAAGAGVAGVVVKVTAEAAVDAVTSIGKEVFSNNKRTNDEHSRTKWCSWCCGISTHKVLASRNVGRDIFECQSAACKKRHRQTLICMRCPDRMARAGATDDLYCTACTTAPRRLTRHCWKCKRTGPFKYRTWTWGPCSRDEYICMGCKARAMPCRRCHLGMAERGMWDNDFCALCHAST